MLLPLVVGLAFAGAGPAPRLVDAALAVVEGRLLTASDVALARALGLFGLGPSAAPIGRDDVERLVGAWLVIAEARRLGIGEGAEDRARAWQAVLDRIGGEAAVRAWLAREGVEVEWARAMVDDDARWSRFVELRFRAFVFVTEDDVTAALGSGPDDPAARARTREALREREAQRRLAAWLEEAQETARVQRLLSPGERVPSPLGMP